MDTEEKIIDGLEGFAKHLEQHAQEPCAGLPMVSTAFGELTHGEFLEFRLTPRKMTKEQFDKIISRRPGRMNIRT